MKYLLILLCSMLITCTTTHNYAHQYDSDRKISKKKPIEEIPRNSFVFIYVKESYKFCFKDKNKERACITIGKPYWTSGSAFIVANNKEGSLVVTAEHVCSPRSKDMAIEYILIDLDGVRYKDAHAVAKDVKKDICMLKVRGLFNEPIQVSKVAPRPGNKLYNLAAPAGIFNKGMVPILEGRYNGISSHGKAIYSIPAAPGSSGSVVLNENFELVGLIDSLHIRFPIISLGPTYDSLKAFIKKNIAKYN